jgi:hypothetical protein
VNREATGLAPIFLVYCRGVCVNVSRKYAFMPQPVESGVEAADTTKQVHEAHEKQLSDGGY